ncbi:MAG: hypothetical protein ACXW37_04940, partial [Nitrospira sp.]
STDRDLFTGKIPDRLVLIGSFSPYDLRDGFDGGALVGENLLQQLTGVITVRGIKKLQDE